MGHFTTADNITTELVDSYVGRAVSVYISIAGHSRFKEDTQVSVMGVLESQDGDRFRVLNNWDNYSYFKTEDVMSIIDDSLREKVHIALIMNNEERKRDLENKVNTDNLH